MFKSLVKVAVISVALLCVIMAPLIIPAEILTHNKKHHHTGHATATTTSTSKTTPFQRLSGG